VSAPDRSYFLGTHDEELERLGIQHGAWRPAVLDCWRRAGIGRGSKVLDVGAGPGFAAADLAEIVGPGGRVVAVERSARFVEAGRAMLAARGHGNVEYHELDLMADPLPAGGMDASWCRWVACFVSSPALLLDKLAAVIRPGGVAIFHEYVEYDTLRVTTAGPRMREFVRQVEQGWREAGGEPNIAPAVVALLQERGFSIRDAIPRVFCARPGDALWRWPATFIDIHLRHQLEMGRIEPAWAEAVREEFAAAEGQAATLLITPMVLEIVAEKRH
jgi:SAM-dependent methyltransferase